MKKIPKLYTKNNKGDTTITGADKKSARGYALESGWVEIGDKHYCPDCCKFNDILSLYV